MNLRTCLLLVLTCSPCLTPTLLWGADPPDKGKGNKGKQTHISAKIKAGEQKWELTPSSLGIFQRLNMTNTVPVEVEIRYPQVAAGILAVVSVRDGGSVSASVTQNGEGDGKGKDKGKGKGGNQTVTGLVVRPRVDEDGKLKFTFLYGSSLHFQRVTVDIGKQQLVFDFHVHP